MRSRCRCVKWGGAEWSLLRLAASVAPEESLYRRRVVGGDLETNGDASAIGPLRGVTGELQQSRRRLFAPVHLPEQRDGARLDERLRTAHQGRAVERPWRCGLVLRGRRRTPRGTHTGLSRRG